MSEQGDKIDLIGTMRNELATLHEQLAERDAEIARLKERSEQQRAERAEAELAKLRHAVDLAARAMYGEGVDDQAQAWDVCLRILDAARADLPEETK